MRSSLIVGSLWTEKLTLISSDGRSARERVATMAEALQLSVDLIKEAPRRSGATRLEITLTGTPAPISDFEDAMGGDGWGSADHNPGDAVVSSILLWAHQRLRRWRRARRARKSPGLIQRTPSQPSTDHAGRNWRWTVRRGGTNDERAQRTLQRVRKRMGFCDGDMPPNAARPRSEQVRNGIQSRPPLTPWVVMAGSLSRNVVG
jgi:hypothetical protein